MTTEKTASQEQAYNIQVTGRHVQVTDGMKQHAVDQISKLDHLAGRIIDVQVVMDIQRTNHECNIIMKYGHTRIKSHASTSDMYASIDQAVAKLDRQLRRYKKRLNDHHAKKIIIEDIPVSVYSVPETDATALDVEHKLVSAETQHLKTLSVDEAIMKMELSQEPCLVFRNQEDAQINVIVRRSDGHYGIIKVA